MSSEAFSLALTKDECEVVQKVWQFSRLMLAAGILDLEQLGDYMEKPWKWQPEFEIWFQHGCPDLDDKAEKFDAFAEACFSLFEEKTL